MLNAKQTDSIKRIASENGFSEYSISVNPATKKGDNYTGNIYLATIRNANRTKNLIVKCADTNLLLRKYIPLKLSYKREIFVYNTVIPCISHLQEEISLPHPAKMFIAMYDYSLDDLEEYLIFDDMKSMGYCLQDRKKTMDDSHVKIVVTELAKLHSISFVLKHLKPELYREFSTKLNDYLKGLLRTSDTEKRVKQLLKRYAKNTEFVKIMETYLKSSTAIFNNDGEDYDLVIIHGDTWCNNLMFKYDKEHPQKPTSCCFLDWQLTKIGSPAYDLCYFFFYATSKGVLNNHKEYLLLYYQIITENLQYIGCDINKIFPFELLEKHWLIFCKSMFLNVVTNLDMVLNDEKTLLEILEDKKSNDKRSADIQHCETYYERIYDILSMIAEYKYY